jgi:hypothetical protein
MLVRMALIVVAAAGLAAPSPRACDPPDGYTSHVVTGSVRAGVPFQAPFGERFAFVLAPIDNGWSIEVRERGRDENLARLTPPWHFVPNPRDIEGWHFRNADNTAANDGSVNAPAELREFYFSPEVGRSLDYLGSATPPETIDSVMAFGRGQLTVQEHELTPPGVGERASFRAMSFQVCLVWRSAAEPGGRSG